MTCSFYLKCFKQHAHSHLKTEWLLNIADAMQPPSQLLFHSCLILLLVLGMNDLFTENIIVLSAKELIFRIG